MPSKNPGENPDIYIYIYIYVYIYIRGGGTAPASPAMAGPLFRKDLIFFS